MYVVYRPPSMFNEAKALTNPLIWIFWYMHEYDIITLLREYLYWIIHHTMREYVNDM